MCFINTMLIKHGSAEWKYLEPLTILCGCPMVETGGICMTHPPTPQWVSPWHTPTLARIENGARF